MRTRSQDSLSPFEPAGHPAGAPDRFTAALVAQATVGLFMRDLLRAARLRRSGPRRRAA